MPRSIDVSMGKRSQINMRSRKLLLKGVAMKRRSPWASICLAMLVLPQVSQAAATGLNEKADAVVVGEVQSGTQHGRQVTFFLTVTRTIKGDIQNGTTLNVLCEWVKFEGGGDVGFHYGLWFLKRNGPDAWVVLPTTESPSGFPNTYIPLSKTNAPAGRISNSKPASVSEGIADELQYVIEHYVDLHQLNIALEGLFDDTDAVTRKRVFRELSANKDPELKFIGFGGLLLMNEPGAFEQIAANADSIGGLKMSRYPVGAIAYVRDGSPATVRTLGKLSLSSNAAVQRAAAQALCDIHTLEALPFLGDLLESSDGETRAWAVKGLSMFVENLPIRHPEDTPSQRWRIRQGPAPYKTVDTDRYSTAERRMDPDPAQEKECVNFWKQWWARMKVELTPK